jgi:hypothetical protein
MWDGNTQMNTSWEMDTNFTLSWKQSTPLFIRYSGKEKELHDDSYWKLHVIVAFIGSTKLIIQVNLQSNNCGLVIIQL